MPDFDIDDALNSADDSFVFAGKDDRFIFWARRKGEWVPVAQLTESQGTWTIAVVYVGGSRMDLTDAITDEMRIPARALMRLGRRPSYQDWLPELRRYWEDYGHNHHWEATGIAPAYRP